MFGLKLNHVSNGAQQAVYVLYSSCENFTYRWNKHTVMNTTYCKQRVNMDSVCYVI